MPVDDAAVYFNPKKMMDGPQADRADAVPELNLQFSSGKTAPMTTNAGNPLSPMANGRPTAGNSLAVAAALPRGGSFMVPVAKAASQAVLPAAEKVDLKDDPFALSKVPQAPPAMVTGTAVSRMPSQLPMQQSLPVQQEVRRGREASPVRVRAVSPIRGASTVMRSQSAIQTSPMQGASFTAAPWQAGSHVAGPGALPSSATKAVEPVHQSALSNCLAAATGSIVDLDQLSASMTSHPPVAPLALPRQVTQPVVRVPPALQPRDLLGGSLTSSAMAANVQGMLSGASVKVKVGGPSPLQNSDGTDRLLLPQNSHNPPPQPLYKKIVEVSNAMTAAQLESKRLVQQRAAQPVQLQEQPHEFVQRTALPAQLQEQPHELLYRAQRQEQEQQQALLDARYQAQTAQDGLYYTFAPDDRTQSVAGPTSYVHYNDGEFADQQFADQQFADQQLADQQFADEQYMNGVQVQTLSDYGHIGQEYNEPGDVQVDADAAAGIPRHTEESRPFEEKHDLLQALQNEMLASQALMESSQEPQQEQGEEDQFTRLLNSLEARVDLMAQMQHTRAQIQKHTRSLQISNPERRAVGMTPDDSPMDQLGDGYGEQDVGFFDMPNKEPVDYERDERMSTVSDGIHAVADVQQYMGMTVVESSVSETIENAEPVDTQRLVQENQILWNQFQDQRDCISKLEGEVEGMRNHLRSFSTDPIRGNDPGTPDNRGSQAASAASLLLSNLTSATRGRNGFDEVHQTFSQSEFEAQAAVPAGGEISSVQEPMAGEAPYEDPTRSDRDVEVKSLHLQLLQERQRQEASNLQWDQERQRLIEELSSLRRRPLGGLPTVGETTEGTVGLGKTESAFPGFAGMDSLATEQVLSAGGLADDAFSGLLSGNEPSPIGRLCTQPIGVNIELSEDGYMARRTRGCRQSVVVGSEPLQLQEQGWYYEVVVRETVNGWVGGLGIGVTRTPPSELRRLPDKGWRIPSTFIVGYWGCVFLDGRERRTRWKADSLTIDQTVGLLITGDGKGDLVVFVDGQPVVRADGVLPSAGRLDPLYPVVDIFAATLSVELQRTALAPKPPWGKNPSPPGSPASVARSTSSLSAPSLSAFDLRS